ncbi:MAG TPA: hypothetical protein VFS43_40265 [Polyangiaceae bacterium]|nr:hypothetical protein [Polyangiaceae bacterium]
MTRASPSVTTRTRLAEARQAALSALEPASQALRRAVHVLGRLRRRDERRERDRDGTRARAYAEAQASIARWGGEGDEDEGPKSERR